MSLFVKHFLHEGPHFHRQWTGHNVETNFKVPAFKINVFVPIFIDSGHNITRWEKVSGFILQGLQSMIIFK
jgi:hypothetical protein